MTLEACSVTELREQSTIFIDKTLNIKMREFPQIFKDNSLKTQALPFILAFIFADCQTTRGSYYKLKLGMLLSLVNCEEANNNDISILAIGQDTEILNRLLQYGANLSSRATRIVSSKQLKWTLSKSRHGNGIYILEGNPLLLSKHGICYFGDLSKFPRATQDTIAKILESRIIPMDCSRVPEGLHAKTMKIDNNFKGSSWAYIDNSSKCSRYLFDEFSIAYCCDDANWETETQVAHSSPYFTVDEMKKIITHAKRIEVHLGPKVEHIIQQYFIASRRVRSSTNTGVEFPISSLLTIARLTSAMAKLSLRTEVLEEDAILAIFMYEEYVTARYRPSQLNVQPQSHVTAGSMLEIVQKMTEDLAVFKNKLHYFLKSYSGDTYSLPPEE